MSDCLFCRIIAGNIPAQSVADTEKLMAFLDIHPQAPTHILIIPKKHIESMQTLQTEDAALIAEMALLAQRLAKEQGLHEGFRLVFNSGARAGQTVFHLHMHLLGGRDMHWPPG